MPSKWCFPLGRTLHNIRNFRQDISLSGIRKVHFLKSEWENFQPENAVSDIYLIYRGAFMLIVMAILLLSLACEDDNAYYLIYLTHWSIITQNIFGTLFFVEVLIGWLKYRRFQAKVVDAEALVGVGATQPKKLGLNYLERIIFVLNPICFVIPMTVMLGFWFFLASPEYIEKHVMRSSCYLPATISVHGLNFLAAALVDGFVNAVPVHITHALYACAYGMLYLFFSLFYEVFNGVYPEKDKPYIYPFINWKEEPLAGAIACVVAVIGGLMFYLSVYCIYALRLFLVSMFKPNTYEEHRYEEGDSLYNGGEAEVMTPIDSFTSKDFIQSPPPTNLGSGSENSIDQLETLPSISYVKSDMEL